MLTKLLLAGSIVVVLFISSCIGQTNTKTMNTNTVNPLLCDTETGLCQVPENSGTTQKTNLAAKQLPVKIIYFTDPICSSCWGVEPQLRKLKLEYSEFFDIEYHMGGLLPSWDIYNSGAISKPSDVAHHWDEVSRYYEMPIDGDVWLEDPLPSSYPPSIAFKAAQAQDKVKAVAFMRNLREKLFLQKKNITKWEYVQQAALEVGLDTASLHTAMKGTAKKAFEDDLTFAKKLGVRGFPTFLFSNVENNQLTVYGFKPYEAFEKTLLQLYPQAVKKHYNTSWESLFGYYPTLTTKEYAVLASISTWEAEKLLMGLESQQKIGKLVTKNGILWRAN